MPRKHIEDDFKLGQWVDVQKRAFKKGTLDPARLKRLEQLGFDWDPHARKWEEGFCKLQKFHQRVGHCLVKATHIEDGHKLGHWVSSQRTKFKKEKLSSTYIKRLEKLGFVWNPVDSQLEEAFSKLKIFVEREGNASIPARYVEDDFKLGNWVQNVRTGKISLTSDQIKKLEDMGFVWNILDSQWEQGFLKLRAFIKREKSSLVPQKHIEDDFKLGQWVDVQKRAFKKGTLDPARLKRLKQLGVATSS